MDLKNKFTGTVLTMDLIRKCWDDMDKQDAANERYMEWCITERNRKLKEVYKLLGIQEEPINAKKGL